MASRRAAINTSAAEGDAGSQQASGRGPYRQAALELMMTGPAARSRACTRLAVTSFACGRGHPRQSTVRLDGRSPVYRPSGSSAPSLQDRVSRRYGEPGTRTPKAVAAHSASDRAPQPFGCSPDSSSSRRARELNPRTRVGHSLSGRAPGTDAGRTLRRSRSPRSRHRDVRPALGRGKPACRCQHLACRYTSIQRDIAAAGFEPAYLDYEPSEVPLLNAATAR